MTKEIVKKKRPGPGQPRKYEPDQLEIGWSGYLQWCIDNSKLPTMIGFCVYLDISKETLYTYFGEYQYSDCKQKIEAQLEAITIQAGTEARNPAFLIFYMKNKFGWSDKNDDQPQTNVNILNLSNLSLAELQKLAAGEAIED